MSHIKELIANLKNQEHKSQIDPSTHKPTPGELNNLCYLSMKYICGWPMRQADLAVVNTMGGEPQTVNDMDKYCEALADYIWDHLMGEPDDSTADEVKEACNGIKNMLYSMDEETRNSIDAVN